MKERPILFSGEMVRAILEGRKTQTRRILQVQPPSDEYQITTLADSTARENRKYIGAHHWAIVKDLKIVADHGKYFRCPYGIVGDRLWVREAISKPFPLDVKSQNFTGFYRATEPERKVQWTPSIHMPRWASRITLEVTGVRVERLQDIKFHDMEAEGVLPLRICGGEQSVLQDEYFRPLWDSINGKRASWESNPWVWVVEFKKI